MHTRNIWKGERFSLVKSCIRAGHVVLWLSRVKTSKYSVFPLIRFYFVSHKTGLGKYFQSVAFSLRILRGFFSILLSGKKFDVFRFQSLELHFLLVFAAMLVFVYFMLIFTSV